MEISIKYLINSFYGGHILDAHLIIMLK